MNADPTLPRLLAQALPHLPDVIALHEPDGTYRLLSPQMKLVTGWRPSDLIGRSPYEMFHPDDIPVVQRRYHDAVLRGASVQGRLRYRHRDGHYLWMEFNSVPIFEPTAESSDRSREITGIITIKRDVTPLITAERTALEQSRHLLQMQDLAGMAWFSVDLVTRQLRHSESFVEITGRAGSTFKNLLSLYRLVHPADRVWVRQALHHLRRIKRGESQTVRVRLNTANQHTRWVRVSLMIGTDDAQGGVERPVLSGVLLDIDDLIRAREETRRWMRQQEISSARERQDIGHELHDEVGQILTGLKWQIEAWQREARVASRGQDRTAPPQGNEAPVSNWFASLDEAHQTLRRIAQRLRPPLAALGLRAAIFKLTSEYTERWLGDTHLELQVDEDLPDGDEWRVNVILGMLRECLNNVARHARAQQVTVVALTTPSRGLLLAVRDNGVGMDMKEARPEGRMGLTSLRERAHMINARLSIDSAPGQGTSVVLELRLDGVPDE